MPHQPKLKDSANSSQASQIAARPAKTKKKPSSSALNENRRFAGCPVVPAAAVPDAAAPTPPMCEW